MNHATRRFLSAGLLAVLTGVTMQGVEGGAQSATGRPVADRGHRLGMLQRCRVPGLDEEVLCGQLRVYEDRSLRSGRQISLNIVVLPATGTTVEPDPVVFLAGGGVLPATNFAARFATALAAVRERRDILLVDQRGTGRSHRLGCQVAADALPSHRHAEAYEQEIRRCRQELEAGADLRLYTTPIAMDDLDEVRGWLGYPRLNLFGVSYGTKAAQVYLRQHPERVRSVVLHGPMPIDEAMWPDLAVNAGSMMDRVFGECESDAACQAAFPELRRDLEAVLARLHIGAQEVQVTTPEGGTRSYTLDETTVRTFVGGASVSRRSMSDLPLFVHAAASGNFRPIAQVMSEEAPSDRTPPRGLFLSILCSETIPLVDPVSYRRSAAASIYGSWAADMPLRECAQWVKATMPDGFWKPVSSPIPTLIMVGEFDAVTPVAYARRLAPRFPKGTVVTLPWRGHNDADPCVMGLAQSFIAAGSADGLDASCVRSSPRLTFRTELRPFERQPAP